MITANLGFPRIGSHRELKFALESYWSGTLSAEQLETVAARLRSQNWRWQAAAGIDRIPCNDFSHYDHVLDTAVLVGAVPRRFGYQASNVDRNTYFSMARGSGSAAAMEMTKWFDSNYHYIVPEFEPGMKFHLASDTPLRAFLDAQAIGIRTRPVLLGPVSFVLLGKFHSMRPDRAATVKEVANVYAQLLQHLKAAGADWVQIDEPFLGLNMDESQRLLFARCYDRLAADTNGLRVLVATYFSGLRENLDLALNLPVHGLHLDLVRAPEQLVPALGYAPASLTLSLGLVDGRNVWRCNLRHALRLLRVAAEKLGQERIEIAPSCSLLHVPVDLEQEHELDPELRSWMAFAKEKLEEVHFLAEAIQAPSQEVERKLSENDKVLQRRQSSARVRNSGVRERISRITPDMEQRHGSAPIRRAQQTAAISVPILPTTTIGSFPQTPELRRARTAFRASHLTQAEYEQHIRGQIVACIRFQEEVGLDVLVHGEFERNDMVEYFAEQMDGFALTREGWVQSYGSRCVKPPILFGDVARPKPMSVAWQAYAQSLTNSPVKAVLTGPVTMMQWSFVRDDLPRQQVCYQLALALRDEVHDLEVAGLRVIQVDEPALREGMPLREADHAEYLYWAVTAFRLSTSVVGAATQIHSHMCYSDFGHFLDVLRNMNADVISIEAARSGLELLNASEMENYPKSLGPGIYDVHAPYVPTTEELAARIRKALHAMRIEQLWINPDCGLKTRRWEEVRPALANMVEATRLVRSELASDSPERDKVPARSAANWPYRACGCT
jgi:5-methyltetrahydropteroyltriglutamate--homocysteine methyltransferase